MVKLLHEVNYDPNEIEFLSRGFTSGFDLHYQGPREGIKYVSPNLKFVVGNKFELWNKVMKEVETGRYAGPYETPPFDSFIQSPIGLVPKDHGTKTRLIFHLSYPRNGKGRKSVNEHTPREFCTVQYKDFDCVVKLCAVEGKGCAVGKTDVISAFRLLPIRPEDWPLLLMKAEHPETGKIYYFVDKCLPVM